MPKSLPLGGDSATNDSAAGGTVRAIAGAARRWRDADFPPRVRATASIVARTGYSQPVVDYALDALFEGLHEDALRAAIAGELGSVDALDGFVPRAGRPDAFAAAVGRVVVIASDTTIGVALPPAAFALCAGCDVLVRDRGDALVAAFAQTLAAEDGAVAARLCAISPPEHDDAAWLGELSRAAAVVAFGGGEALGRIRARTAPECRFVGFGHRTSVSYVAREALSDAAAAGTVAQRVAADALLYEGEGCLSSHAVFAERAASVDEAAFAALVVAAARKAAVEFPPGEAQPDLGIAYRDACRFRAAQGRGDWAWIADGRALVVADPPRDEPPPLMPRTLAVYAVDGPEELTQFVRAHALPLEAIALEPMPARDDVLAAAVRCGPARVARVGALQRPSFAAEHGGFGRIAPFVRWITRDS